MWESFLNKAARAKGRAKYTPDDLDWLSKKEMNRQQIKYMINTAHTLAVEEMVQLSRSYLQVLIGLDEIFLKAYNGVGRIANNLSYV
ncbi:MAG: hypothetical protein L6R38_006262 [Xanthoria sp. 2 TBL-2021]|nr:MAG: hypothetical protein L6R38_006262 [Xanthoria sp. 2 TBL-2021]